MSTAAPSSPPATRMARYKFIDANPRLLPVDLARLLLPGTFEHALNHMLDRAIDLSSFDARVQLSELVWLHRKAEPLLCRHAKRDAAA